MAAASRIVILGGTRGLGKALAREFLDRGSRVFITGTARESLDAALGELSRGREAGSLGGGVADLLSPADLPRVAAEARAFLGGIDHWINNAGINQEPGRLLDLAPEEYERILRVDLLGPLIAARAARPYLEESSGWAWFMEGHGSDGRIMDGLSLYGTSKRGLAYLWRAMAKEEGASRIRIGALSPGIMATDFILQGREKEDAEAWKRKAKILNILADKPETVAAFLAPRILGARKNGRKITWLTNRKVMARFMMAPVARRHIVE
jgi:NAD(P)-dependent dehydrogenase (short-subunit alcohol dehydrogenase family)